MRVDSRRFPRTLKEAFPEERFPVLEISRPARHKGDTMIFLLCIILLFFIVAGGLGWLF